MQTEFVIAKCDVYCEWTDPPPRYRWYINDELFSERTWIWRGSYLEESFQIQALPGKYSVKFEMLDPERAMLKVRNLRVEHGPGLIGRDGLLHIYVLEHTNEST